MKLIVIVLNNVRDTKTWKDTLINQRIYQRFQVLCSKFLHFQGTNIMLSCALSLLFTLSGHKVIVILKLLINVLWVLPHLLNFLMYFLLRGGKKILQEVTLLSRIPAWNWSTTTTRCWTRPRARAWQLFSAGRREVAFFVILLTVACREKGL